MEEWFRDTNIGSARHREVTSRGRCQSEPQKSVRYTEVSTIMCPLHRGFFMRVWLSFHLFLRKVYVLQRCLLYRMSAIRRFLCNFLSSTGIGTDKAKLYFW